MTVPFISGKLVRTIGRRSEGQATPPPLESMRLAIKLFARDPSRADAEKIVRVFHRWIQDGELEEEQPIDVVRYTHVPNAPLVLLVCTEGQYSIDARHGRIGVRYARTRPDEGTPRERLARTIERAFGAAKMLERDTEIRFGANGHGPDEAELEIADRLLAPNNEETFARLAKELKKISRRRALAIEHRSKDDPRGLLRVGIFGISKLTSP